MSFACIGLGSNLGDSLQILKGALTSLQKSGAIQLQKCSACYLSKPWGRENQPDFFNAVAGIQTDLSALNLLSFLQQIEQEFDRQRAESWGPRTLDLDILCYENLQQNDPTLRLPHPHFAERDFVLVPLAEIYPDLVISGKRVSLWLEQYLSSALERPLPAKLDAKLV
ncbi:MAG: 2-amino-4-hydroxy-6-hydroxymethyldihydropteridine diphosphokinase [Pseudomonadales bacterium]